MVYYLGYHDNIITSEDLKKAFYISTGMDADVNEAEFWRFRENCFGRSIQKTIPASVETLLEMGYKVKAIWLYREQNNCTIAEAKRAVDEMEEAMGVIA